MRGGDINTMLIDRLERVYILTGYGQNLQTQITLNAFMDYIGCRQPLKSRYNYYDNTKK
ncbi:MAG: hypothetical protein K0R77_720 [Chryseobacterium sp.]|jgi:hypothetical protein|nr:hypothetical protein [Chryseobacterium sp.]